MIKLKDSIKNIKGIGKYYSSLLQKRNIYTARDLIWLTPKSSVRLPVIGSISNIENELVAINLTIISVILKTKPRLITFVKCRDLTGNLISVTFFSSYKLFYVGSKICVYGQLIKQKDLYVMTHPKWVPYHKEYFEEIEYGIQNVPSAIISRIISEVLNELQIIPEWIPINILSKNRWLSFHDSLKIMHGHTSNMTESARQRLKLDEALAYQYCLHRASAELSRNNNDYTLQKSSINDIIENFGYPLTESQVEVWGEISADLSSHNRMIRLLYGDVGSGKTLIAFLAIVSCYRAGKQAALLAPTEILARQHFEGLKKLMPNNNNIILLTSSTKSVKLYRKIAEENCIVIGTHAILQEKVKYLNLGLLVIDEQHRFGVLQRMAIDDSICYNVLLMTATPIPRTCHLLMSNMIPISKILTRPQTNRIINKYILFPKRIPELIEKIHKLLDEGDNIFWVCPFIIESKRDGMDLETRYKELNKHFGDIVGVLHGKLSNAEKNRVLEAFYNNEYRVLLSTTVIEVGVNIPHANTIVIENAELFGMAQLYQLIGRVGRGNREARCFIVTYSQSYDTKKRLEAIKFCETGLELAEEDMYIRGFGNILGCDQSGEVYFKYLDVQSDHELFKYAQEIIQSNIDNLEFMQRLQYLLECCDYLYSPWVCG